MSIRPSTPRNVPSALDVLEQLRRLACSDRVDEPKHLDLRAEAKP